MKFFKSLIPSLLVLLIALPAWAGTHFAQVVGNPPACTKAAFKPWMEKLLAFREAETPLARTTTMYFSTSGNNANLGTFASPKQTIAHANTIIASSGGNIRIRLRRGDLWRESVGFVVGVNNVTIDAYSDGTAGHEMGNQKPTLDKFQAPYGQGIGWVNTSGLVYEKAESGTVEAMREEEDVTNAYIECSSIAQVQTYEGSWWWDSAVSKLYVHMRGNKVPSSGNTPKVQVCYRNTVRGINVSGSNTRVENIRVDGYGVDPTTEGSVHWGIILQSGPVNATLLCKGVEIYYCTYHGIGMSSSDGILTCIDSTVGFHVDDTSGISFVAYDGDGGQEGFFYNCGTTVGEIWRPGFNYTVGYDGSHVLVATPQGAGVGGNVYGHTSAGTSALQIAWRCWNKPGQYQTGGDDAFSNTPTFTNLEDCRAWVVDGVFRMRDRTALDASRDNSSGANWAPSFSSGTQGPPYRQIYVNCTREARIVASPGDTDDVGLTGVSSELHINCHLIYDYTGYNAAPPASWHNTYVAQSATAANGHYYNCLWDFRTSSCHSLTIAYLWTLQNSGSFTNFSQPAPTLVANNCIFSGPTLSIPGQTTDFFLGLNNNAANIYNNAYYGVTNKTLVNVGYNSDPVAVDLPAYQAGVPLATSPLISRSTRYIFGKYRLEFDKNWNPRATNGSAIGPWEYSRRTVSPIGQ